SEEKKLEELVQKIFDSKDLFLHNPELYYQVIHLCKRDLHLIKETTKREGLLKKIENTVSDLFEKEENLDALGKLQENFLTTHFLPFKNLRRRAFVNYFSVEERSEKDKIDLLKGILCLYPHHSQNIELNEILSSFTYLIPLNLCYIKAVSQLN